MTRGDETVGAPVTDLLAAWRGGDIEAREELFQRVYAELRRLAGAQVRMRSATMAPTELVHETYLKLLAGQRVGARDREHFYSLAARAMRHILVDAKRRQHALKRGGPTPAETLDNGLVGDSGPPRDDLLALDAALSALEALDPELVRIVELRHFAGLTVEETASELGTSERTVKRRWRAARAFLHDHLSREARENARADR